MTTDTMRHNYGMSVRTTIDLPDDLYELIRRRAASDRTSVRALVVGAVERRYGRRARRKPVLERPVPGAGKPGPLCPDTENPYDLLFTGHKCLASFELGQSYSLNQRVELVPIAPQ
jgi:hypothetical protein